jgi:peptidoglycan/xylan/chitin deacetylase (PgdA/CDA1 family)
LTRILINVVRVMVDIISVCYRPFAAVFGNNKVRILCYHRVCDIPETKDYVRNITVKPVEFERQMSFLSENGFNVITLEQFIEEKIARHPPEKKTIVITFDDGYRDNYLNAFPILKRYEFNASFFLVTDYIGGDSVFPWLKLTEASLRHYQANTQYWLPLKEEDIIAMSSGGACFGSHTRSHCYLRQVGESQALEELKSSRTRLEEILKKPVRCFCYPFGGVDKNLIRLVGLSGYEAATGLITGSNTNKSDFLNLKRISIDGQDSFIKYKMKVAGGYDWYGTAVEIWGLVKKVFRNR